MLPSEPVRQIQIGQSIAPSARQRVDGNSKHSLSSSSPCSNDRAALVSNPHSPGELSLLGPAVRLRADENATAFYQYPGNEYPRNRTQALISKVYATYTAVPGGPLDPMFICYYSRQFQSSCHLLSEGRGP